MLVPCSRYFHLNGDSLFLKCYTCVLNCENGRNEEQQYLNEIREKAWQKLLMY